MVLTCTPFLTWVFPKVTSPAYFSFAPVKHRPMLFCKHFVNGGRFNNFALNIVGSKYCCWAPDRYPVVHILVCSFIRLPLLILIAPLSNVRMKLTFESHPDNSTQFQCDDLGKPEPVLAHRQRLHPLIPEPRHTV